MVPLNGTTYGKKSLPVASRLATTARGGTPVVIAAAEIDPVELRLAVVEVQVRHPIREVAEADGIYVVLREHIRVNTEADDLDFREAEASLLPNKLLGVLRRLASHGLAILYVVYVVGILGGGHHVGDGGRLEVGAARLVAIAYHRRLAVDAEVGTGDDREKGHAPVLEAHLSGLGDHLVALFLEHLHDRRQDAAILESRDLGVEELLEVATLGLLGFPAEQVLGLGHGPVNVARVGLSEEPNQLLY